MGPGPGPCASLKFAPAVALLTSSLNGDWIWPDPVLRGVRSRGEFCANAVMLSVIAIAEAIAREIRRTLTSMKFKSDLLFVRIGIARAAPHKRRSVRPLYGSQQVGTSHATLGRGARNVLEFANITNHQAQTELARPPPIVLQ
jgi:hypothetical protein